MKVATIKTPKGTIRIQLHDDKAPKTVANFEKLAGEGFYNGLKFHRGAGCDACNNTGYKGRCGIFELMIMNDELREMILQGATNDEMRDVARGYGMVSLRDAGMQFACDGTTTVDEVIRETILDA